jgi:hypothetical protein
MSRVLKTGRIMNHHYAPSGRPEIPTRESCSDLNDAEFAEWENACKLERAEWDRNQGSSVKGHTDDVKHGPGVK